MPEFQNRERSSENKLVVRRETLPARCEICHQSDMLDAASGICRRCESLESIITAEERRTVEGEIGGGCGILVKLFLFFAVFCLLCGGLCSILSYGKDHGGGLFILAVYFIILFFTVLRWLRTDQLKPRNQSGISVETAKAKPFQVDSVPESKR